MTAPVAVHFFLPQAFAENTHVELAARRSLLPRQLGLRQTRFPVFDENIADKQDSRDETPKTLVPCRVVHFSIAGDLFSGGRRRRSSRRRAGRAQRRGAVPTAFALRERPDAARASR